MTFRARLLATLRAVEPIVGVRSNLSILSLLPARPGMPDPVPARATIADLLRRTEAT